MKVTIKSLLTYNKKVIPGNYYRKELCDVPTRPEVILLNSEPCHLRQSANTALSDDYNISYKNYLAKRCNRSTIAHLSEIPRNPAFHQISAVSSSSRTHRLKYNAHVQNMSGTSMDPKLLYGQSKNSCEMRLCKK